MSWTTEQGKCFFESLDWIPPWRDRCSSRNSCLGEANESCLVPYSSSVHCRIQRGVKWYRRIKLGQVAADHCRIVQRIESDQEMLLIDGEQRLLD